MPEPFRRSRGPAGREPPLGEFETLRRQPGDRRPRVSVRWYDWPMQTVLPPGPRPGYDLSKPDKCIQPDRSEGCKSILQIQPSPQVLLSLLWIILDRPLCTRSGCEYRGPGMASNVISREALPHLAPGVIDLFRGNFKVEMRQDTVAALEGWLSCTRNQAQSVESTREPGSAATQGESPEIPHGSALAFLVFATAYETPGNPAVTAEPPS